MTDTVSKQPSPVNCLPIKLIREMTYMLSKTASTNWPWKHTSKGFLSSSFKPITAEQTLLAQITRLCIMVSIKNEEMKGSLQTTDDNSTGFHSTDLVRSKGVSGHPETRSRSGWYVHTAKWTEVKVTHISVSNITRTWRSGQCKSYLS